MASEDGGSTARLAVLIDADNAQPAISCGSGLPQA
jgi:hypothetical protein